MKLFEKTHGMLSDSLSAFRKKKKKTKRKIVISAAAVIVAGAFTLNFLAKSKNSGSSVTYEDVTVSRRDISVELTGTATIEPINQYSVTAMVSGDVLKAPFEEGGAVKKGDLLYSIDTSDAENSVKKAELSAQKAQRSYEEALTSKDNLNVKSDISGVIEEIKVNDGDSVQNGAAIAKVADTSVMLLKAPFNTNDAKRIKPGDKASVTVDGSYETLSGTVTKVSAADEVLTGNMLVRDVTIRVKNPGAVTSESYGTAVVGSFACNSGANFEPLSEKTIIAKTSGDVAAVCFDEGAHVNKGDTVVRLKSDNVDTEIENARLSIEDAQLSLENTNKTLDKYNITSPISGTVIEKDFKVGDTIDTSKSGATVAVIYDLSSLQFKLSVDELDVSKVKVGQAVTVTSDALEGKTFAGTVSNVSIKGTTANGVTTYPVTVLLKNAAGLIPGMNVDAKIQVESAENVLAIPVDAVERGNKVLLKTGGSKSDKSDEASGPQAESGASPAAGSPGGGSASGGTGSEASKYGSTKNSRSGANLPDGKKNGKMRFGSTPEGYSWVTVTLGINNDDYIEVKSGLSEGDVIGVKIVKTESKSTGTGTGVSAGMTQSRTVRRSAGGGGEPGGPPMG